MTPIEFAHSIVGFLENIDNDEDAKEFVRIALDSLANLAEATNKHYEREPILAIISMMDNRISPFIK